MKKLFLMLGIAAFAVSGVAFAEGDVAVTKKPKATFESVDKDNSKSISFDELKAVKPKITKEQFDKKDSDKNEQLSKEEYLAAKGYNKGANKGEECAKEGYKCPATGDNTAAE